jgi:AraC-like DNA-binding protein
MVSVVDSGAGLVERGDKVTELRPGDIGLYVTDEPYRLKFTAGAVRHTFQIPFDELALPRDLVVGQIASATHPDHVITAAISAFLLSTGRLGPDASPAEQAALHRPTVDLIRLLLTRPVADSLVGREAAAKSLATRVQEHITSQLDDPHLSARSIAASFSISERYVYSILRRRGIDLGDLVRAHKLDKAIRMLEDPRLATLKIATVAYECGFSDHAHFSRVFHARYGVSPSEWRSNARPVAD